MKLLILVQGTIHPEYLVLDGASCSTWQIYNDPDIKIISYYGNKDLDGNIINVFRCQPKDEEVIYDDIFNKLIYGGQDFVRHFPEYQLIGFEGSYSFTDEPRPVKRINTLEYCVKNFEFDYIYLTSDSYYIDVKKLKQFLLDKKVDTTKVYTGAIFSEEVNGKSPRWCMNYNASSNCLMSRDTVEELVKYKELYLKLASYQPEDCAMGDVLVNNTHYIDIKKQYGNRPSISYQDFIPYENIYLDDRYDAVCYKIHNIFNYRDTKRFMKMHYLIENKNSLI